MEKHNEPSCDSELLNTPLLYSDLLSLIKQDPVNSMIYIIHKNDALFPGMRVPVRFYLNEELYELFKEEIQASENQHGKGGFISAVRQLLNVSCLPGIVGASIGLPDIHSGYGFAIGNVAAFDTADPHAIVSPGGVGFDINCGVRLVRTNLSLKHIRSCQDELVKSLYNHVPVGIGGNSTIKLQESDVNDILSRGIEWAIDNGYAWPEDGIFCEENGCMKQADSHCVSDRAKFRGKSQLGTLGCGNHYVEIQAVDEIYDIDAASIMGITSIGQICIMIHSGSRGLGHQVATDYISEMQQVMKQEHIIVNDRQLACAPISSKQGQAYIKAMSAAANFAYCNRSCITYHTRNAFEQVFKKTSHEMEMNLIYDVSHNMAKFEDHIMSDGYVKQLLVHRKGSTRAFPPYHPSLPDIYKPIGQPVLVGGSMGTCSYLLLGTSDGMKETFGSTCHGAGRAQSRTKAKKSIPYQDLLKELESKNISVYTSSVKGLSEEAPESYKNVSSVVDTCDAVGISRKIVKLIPIGVIKG